MPLGTSPVTIHSDITEKLDFLLGAAHLLPCIHKGTVSDSVQDAFRYFTDTGIENLGSPGGHKVIQELFCREISIVPQSFQSPVRGDSPSRRLLRCFGGKRGKELPIEESKPGRSVLDCSPELCDKFFFLLPYLPFTNL